MKLKTPLSHLTNNMTFEIDFERIEALSARVLLKREPVEEWAAEQAQEDAMLLCLLAKSLVEDLHRLNDDGPTFDLCPLCGGHTWGRPGRAGEEIFSQRRCHRCGHIRPDPKDDTLHAREGWFRLKGSPKVHFFPKNTAQPHCGLVWRYEGDESKGRMVESVNEHERCKLCEKKQREIDGE